MKKIIFTICLMCGSFYSYSQAADCSEFKDGTFKFTDPGSKKVCIITRDGDTQTERMEDSQETYTFDLKWIDECTYTINPTSSTVQKRKEVLRLGTMTVKIVPDSDSTYTQTVQVANSPKYKRRDKVLVVRDKK